MFRLPVVRYRLLVLMPLLAITLAACASIEVVMPATETPIQSAPATQPAPTQTEVQPTPTQVSLPTKTPIQPTPTEMVAQVNTSVPGNTPNATYTVDISGVAQGASAKTVPAVVRSDNSPYWESLPEYVRVTLDGYPVSGHLMQPQIFLYPANDLPGWNENAGKQVDDLRAILASRQAGERMPQLPMFNAAQVMHSQVKFLDFKTGQGVRFVTQYDQAVLPINNHELIYTFQGLTSDGKYYVSAVLPVNFPGLPASELTMQEPSDPFFTDFPGYMAGMVKKLNEAEPGVFTPDLAKLDALIMSLEVK